MSHVKLYVRAFTFNFGRAIDIAGGLRSDPRKYSHALPQTVEDAMRADLDRIRVDFWRASEQKICRLEEPCRRELVARTRLEFADLCRDREDVAADEKDDERRLHSLRALRA